MKKTNTLLIIFIIIIQVFTITTYATNVNTSDEKDLVNSASSVQETNNTEADLDLICDAAIIIEEKSGKVIFEKNADKQLYPASTTKIMTAILALEKCQLSDEVTIQASSLKEIPSGYVTANVLAGETFTVEELLYALLLPSANDIAVVLADHISGSVEEFSKLMNQKAKEIGCTNTNFVNPNGIHNSDHYSNANDLVKIAKYCMQNQAFKQIVSTQKYTLPATKLHPQEDRKFENTNELILENSKYYYENAIGIKTGYTKEAGNCLISASKKDGLTYICVVLNGGSADKNARFKDSKKLFEYGYENFNYIDFKKENEMIYNITVNKAKKEQENLNLKLENGFNFFGKLNYDYENIKPEINLNDNIVAPIQANEVLGSVTYTIDGTDYTTNLLAASDVEKRFNYEFYSISCGCGVLFFAITGMVSSKSKKKKISKRKKRTY